MAVYSDALSGREWGEKRLLFNPRHCPGKPTQLDFAERECVVSKTTVCETKTAA
jgi:hypothetical protein